jgi:hypothetical protein
VTRYGRSKHTPGPWEIVREMNGRPIHESLGTPIKKTGHTVAWVEFDDLSPETSRANAALVAAAPELLEALRAAIPCLARAVVEGAFDRCAAPGVGRSALHQAEVAVDKAEGKG